MAWTALLEDKDNKCLWALTPPRVAQFNHSMSSRSAEKRVGLVQRRPADLNQISFYILWLYFRSGLRQVIETIMTMIYPLPRQKSSEKVRPPPPSSENIQGMPDPLPLWSLTSYVKSPCRYDHLYGRRMRWNGETVCSNWPIRCRCPSVVLALDPAFLHCIPITGERVDRHKCVC